MPVPGRGQAARERHRARPLQPRPRVAVLEPEHGEGRVEALLLVVDALEDAVHHLPAGRPDAVGPAPDAARVPVGVRSPLGKVVGMSRVAVPRERREERVRRQPLAGEEDLHGGVGDPQVHRPAHGEVAHRVVVALVGDVAVALHLPAVDPLADLVGHRRQRPQERPLLLLEDLPARALALGEGPRVVLLELLRHSPLELVEIGEDLVPQRGDDLQGGLPHLVLGTRLVARRRDARRHHRRAVVGGHLAIGLVQLDLALARVGPHAGPEVVGHYAGRRAAHVGERVHVAAKPCILSHVQRRLDVGQAAEGQGGHEQEDLGDLARGGVDERHRRPRPVDLKNPAGPVPDAAHDLLPHRELAVALAEAVVGHEGLALRPLLVAVLLVQPLERDPDPGELAVHALPVGVRVDVPVADLLGEERGVDLRIRHPLGLRPADPRRLGGLGHRLDAVLRHSLRPRDRVSRHARLEQSQDLPGPDLPRHVLPPSLSVAWRAERRRRRCRTGIRLVPNGNIGRWMERCRIAIPRVLTGAITHHRFAACPASSPRPFSSSLAWTPTTRG